MPVARSPDRLSLTVMPASSSSLQAARQRLGGKLRELRLAAGRSGRAFADAAGCQASKVYPGREGRAARLRG